MTSYAPVPDAPWTDSGQDKLMLEVTCLIEIPDGWLDVNDGYTYTLHRDTRNQWSQTLRRQTVASMFVAGSFTVNETPEDVQEQLAVIVTGDTHHGMELAKDQLIEAVQASQFQLVWSVEDTVERWKCKAADVSVTSEQPMLFARKCVVQAQVPRHPVIERRMA
jgi:hypothetical protein